MNTQAHIAASPACSPEDTRPLVLHVVTALDFGGVESHMAMLGRLRRHGSYRHAFCAIGQGGRVGDALSIGGAQVICLGAAVRIPSMAALAALLRCMRTLRPTVVHAHGAEANFHALPIAALAGVPVRIGEEIGIPAHGRLARFGFRTAFGSAQRVLGVSQSVRDWLVRTGEVPAGKALTLLNPVEIPAVIDAVELAPTPLRIGFVGRLEPVKNLEALVAAFAQLLASGVNAQLQLVGEGSLRARLEALAMQLGVRRRIDFAGFQDDPAPLMRQWHLAVLPSLSEGFGLALVEAMGCQVPVVATQVGVAPDIIQDGVSGWLVDGFDSDAIARALQRACALPPARLRAIGQCARIQVRDMFDPREYLTQLEALYRSLDLRDSAR